MARRRIQFSSMIYRYSILMFISILLDPPWFHRFRFDVFHHSHEFRSPHACALPLQAGNLCTFSSRSNNHQIKPNTRPPTGETKVRWQDSILLQQPGFALWISVLFHWLCWFCSKLKLTFSLDGASTLIQTKILEPCCSSNMMANYYYYTIPRVMC